ncbi:MAG: DUF3313 domain-containing protein [Steroidobacteraceae bacterium]
MNTTSSAIALAISLVLAPAAGLAQEDEETFLSDYSGLKATADNPSDELYIAPDALARIGKYKSVMVDQPELFIHPESKYTGMKPDDMKAIADALRAAMMTELEGGYQIVDAPGPDVLYVRVAVGDLMLKKHKRGIMSYTPIGFVVHGAVGLTKEVTEKIDLKGMQIEGEVLDSVSLDQLAAFTMNRGSLGGKSEAEATSWDELVGLFGVVGKRLRCRLDNSGKPESEWTQCGTIAYSPPAQ